MQIGVSGVGAQSADVVHCEATHVPSMLQTSPVPHGRVPPAIPNSVH